MNALQQTLDRLASNPHLQVESVRVEPEKRAKIREALKKHYDDDKIEKYFNWVDKYPKGYKFFHQIVFDLIKRGKKAGAIDIFGKIRWDYEIEKGEDYKMNNNWAPLAAISFTVLNPKHVDFFAFRK